MNASALKKAACFIALTLIFFLGTMCQKATAQYYYWRPSWHPFVRTTDSREYWNRIREFQKQQCSLANLLYQTENGQTSSKRKEAISLLERFPESKEKTNVLERALYDVSPNVRRAAVKALLRQKSSYHLRIITAGLAKLPNRENVFLLALILCASQDVQVRQEAAKSLAEIAKAKKELSPIALNALKIALSREILEQTRERIIKAIAAISEIEKKKK